MKVRRDAKLKSLPVAQQGEVVRVLTETGITAASLERLHTELGIDVRSIKTLSEFWHWYHAPQQKIAREMEAAGSVTDFVMANLRKDRPEISDEELFSAGQRFFSELAITMQDPKAWVMTQSAGRDRERVRLKGDEVELARQKFQRDTCELFLKWAEDERAKSIAGSGATNSEKIEQLGRLMFGEGW